jgi:hypothetical protein
MSSGASDLDFQEVQNQLQILENIAYKEGLSDRKLAWHHELQVREKERIREELAQHGNPRTTPTCPSMSARYPILQPTTERHGMTPGDIGNSTKQPKRSHCGICATTCA